MKVWEPPVVSSGPDRVLLTRWELVVLMTVALLKMMAMGCRLLEAEEGLALICKVDSAVAVVVETLPPAVFENVAGSLLWSSEPAVWFEFDVGIDVKVDGEGSKENPSPSGSVDKVSA